MAGTPLPEPPGYLRNSPIILSAYRQVLNLERDEQTGYSNNGTDDRRKRLISARVVGYLILEGPSDQARIAVALAVISCNNEAEKLLAIGQYYCDHYLRAFKRYKGRTPAASDHVSRPSFDSRRAMILDMMVEAPQNHKQAKDNALVRDGFRCVVTGQYDANSVERNKELERAAGDGDNVSPTECAHIFPESTNANISGSNAQGVKHQYAAGVWAVLDRFGYQKILDELNGAKIHRLENVLTLDSGVHNYFDTLKIWFEPVEPSETPNTYRLRAARPFYIRSSWKTTVTFTTPDPVALPVPSRDYLELHAACCRVANLSGAGELIDRILRELEDIQVLSQDGTSAEALQYALLPFSQLISVC